MSVKEIDPRGALGRLTRSAFGKSKSLPPQSDMDDSARLSQALDELDACRAAREAAQNRLHEIMDDNHKLRLGMVGDYDLDAWLDWVGDKSQNKALLAENEMLAKECEAIAGRLIAALSQCRILREALEESQRCIDQLVEPVPRVQQLLAKIGRALSSEVERKEGAPMVCGHCGAPVERDAQGWWHVSPHDYLGGDHFVTQPRHAPTESPDC